MRIWYVSCRVDNSESIICDLTNEEQPVAIEERNEGPDEGDMTFTEQITDDGLRVVNPTGNVPYPQPPSGEEQSQQPQSHTVTSEELNEKNDEILEHIDPVPQCSYLWHSSFLFFGCCAYC